MKNLLRQTIIYFIRGYRYFISPLLGKNCRFHPPCSQYTIEAFEKLSLWKATLKSIWRIMRCHPISKGGYDPVK